MTAGTVAVTSANSLVGRELLLRLAAAGIEADALVRSPVDLPATRTVTDWMRSPATAQVLEAAETVVHLSGEISAGSAAGYDAANVATTRVVVSGLRPGQRVIFVSYLGADPASANLFLAAKGRAERLLIESPAAAVILRTQIIAHPIDAPGGFEDAIRRTAPGAAVRLIGDGHGMVRPIAQSDVVAAILAGVDGGCPAGVHELVGPEAMTLDDVVRRYNADPGVKISHTPGWLARPLSRIVPDLTPTFVDLFLRSGPPGDPEPLASTLGLRLTPMSELWAADPARA